MNFNLSHVVACAQSRLCLALAMSALCLGACAGTETNLEEAEYYVARGGTGNGAKAAAELQPLVDQMATLPLSTALQVAQLYIGAKIAESGFDGINVITNLVYQEGDDTVRALSNIVPNLSDANDREEYAAIVAILDDTDTMMSALLAREDVVALDVFDVNCAPTKRCKDLRAVRLVWGFRFLVDAIARSTLDTTFFAEDLLAASCIESVSESPDAIPLALLRARANFNFAQLDDPDAEMVEANVAGNFAGDFVAAAAGNINTLIEFVNDYQNAGSGAFTVDPDLDGALGEAADGLDLGGRATEFCNYLEGQRE